LLAELRRAFPRRLYRRRAQVESLFSSVKRKLSARAPKHSEEVSLDNAFALIDGTRKVKVRTETGQLQDELPEWVHRGRGEISKGKPAAAGARLGHPPADDENIGL
jgi:hypothetical protein